VCAFCIVRVRMYVWAYVCVYMCVYLYVNIYNIHIRTVCIRTCVQVYVYMYIHPQTPYAQVVRDTLHMRMHA
jgi:hypothetical protein